MQNDLLLDNNLRRAYFRRSRGPGIKNQAMLAVPRVLSHLKHARTDDLSQDSFIAVSEFSMHSCNIPQVLEMSQGLAAGASDNTSALRHANDADEGLVGKDPDTLPTIQALLVRVQLKYGDPRVAGRSYPLLSLFLTGCCMFLQRCSLPITLQRLCEQSRL